MGFCWLAGWLLIISAVFAPVVVGDVVLVAFPQLEVGPCGTFDADGFRLKCATGTNFTFSFHSGMWSIFQICEACFLIEIEL